MALLGNFYAILNMVIGFPCFRGWEKKFNKTNRDLTLNVDLKISKIKDTAALF